MTCTCFIVPQDILKRFASDPSLRDETRSVFDRTANVSRLLRAVREQQTAFTLAAMPFSLAPAVALVAPALRAASPSLVYDCQQGTSTPGLPVSNPSAAADGPTKRACEKALAVARFYLEVFGRDSIDDNHMTLVSSVHYSVGFTNAFWNGAQMIYGDGDGEIFADFTNGDDVIGHELTHGVTQHSAGLVYSDEAGGLNESFSDVFGSMFRQWQSGQDVVNADWLIGKEIMGPAALARGYTCLRDLANPAAAHCLAPQPTHYSQYQAGMDPHYSSGIPNLAFYKAAMAVGGQSWTKLGKVWYEALTNFAPSPNLSMSQFANRTRTISGNSFPNDATVSSAVDKAWTAVGL